MITVNHPRMISHNELCFSDNSCSLVPACTSCTKLGTKEVCDFPAKTVHRAPASKCLNKPSPHVACLRTLSGVSRRACKCRGTYRLQPSRTRCADLWLALYRQGTRKRPYTGVSWLLQCRFEPNCLSDSSDSGLTCSSNLGNIRVARRLPRRGRQSLGERHAIVCRRIQPRAMTVSQGNVLFSQLIWSRGWSL